MIKKLPSVFVGIFLAACVQWTAVRCEAHVLVYRLKLLSSTKESASGVEKETWPKTMSLLAMIDLDTDFYEGSVEDGTKQLILLDERGNQKSFKYREGASSDYSAAEWGSTKFGFFGKNNSKFYLFTQDYKDFGASGVDHGATVANGPCSLNVDIGGGRKSSVPKDFTATQRRGDGDKFKTNVFALRYDSTITKAVNKYLNDNGLFSVKGSKKSVGSAAAYKWLSEVYLPPLYSAPFPYDGDL